MGNGVNKVSIGGSGSVYMPPSVRSVGPVATSGGRWSYSVVGESCGFEG
jgi:hypothetical protein